MGCLIMRAIDVMFMASDVVKEYVEDNQEDKYDWYKLMELAIQAKQVEMLSHINDRLKI